MLALLMLPVGLSSVSIMHNLEMETETHLQHQCEICDAAQAAVLSSESELFIATQRLDYSHLVVTAAPLHAYELPRKRSPPFV